VEGGFVAFGGRGALQEEAIYKEIKKQPIINHVVIM
jgi:hypothetical protein